MTDTSVSDLVQSPSVLNMFTGYVACVAVAALTAAVAMVNGDPYAPPFLAVLLMGIPYIAVAGLPGFALTVVLAHRHGWSGWLPFTLCGGLNVLLAWVLLGCLTGASMGGADSELFKATLRAGVAGGVTYWWVAYHLIRR